MSDTERFLTALYGDLDDGLMFYVWELATKRASYYQDPTEAAERWAGETDVFCSVGITKTPQSRGRLSSVQVDGIVGLVADIDCGGDHQPPTLDIAVTELLAEMPSPPTRIVWSGGGVHGWWLFKEPWTFADDAERDLAAATSRGWGEVLKAEAAAHEWVVDSVYDLARVMRLPGTLNAKYDPPRDVTMVDAEGLLFNPSDFEQYKHEEEQPTRGSAQGVTLDAKFPVHKHEVLLVNAPAYKRTWEHTRVCGDGSASAYEFSLAQTALRAQWSDSEVAVMLRAHREKWAADNKEKIDRVDYYTRTITRARQAVEEITQDDVASEVLNDPDAEREDKIAAIACKLQIPLEDIELITGPPGIYVFFVEGKSVEMPAKKMGQQTLFQGEIFDLTKHWPKPVATKGKPGEKTFTWRDMLHEIANAARETEGNPERTLQGDMTGILCDMLEEWEIAEVPEGTLVEYPDTPFVRSNRLWLRLKNLRRWLKGQESKLTRGDLIHRLERLGTTHTKHACKGLSGMNTTVNFYGVPMGIFTDRGLVISLPRARVDIDKNKAATN